MLDEYINELRVKVEDMFRDNADGHDIGHLERVMKLALKIQETEGGDRIVIGIAAFLHDIHRIMGDELGRYVEPKESLPKVRELLQGLDLSEKQINDILYSIEFHEDKATVNIKHDLNTLILQDADNLDGIGAMGIGRAFKYDALRGVPMYVEDRTLKDEKNISTIHFLKNQVLIIGRVMNTKTAKKYAKKRLKYVQNFINEFISEWNVKYWL